MNKYKKRKLFDERLKKIHLEHKPEKYDRRYPYNWIKEWGPFIKYDADWDGAYLLDLIIYKLERMYIGLDIYSYEVREDLNKRLAGLKEVIDLGKKIQSFDYDQGSTAFRREHTYDTISLYKKGHLLENPLHKIIREKNKLSDYDHLDRYLGKQEIADWCYENNYNIDDLTVAYSAEWDTEDNYANWLNLIKKEEQEEQDDTNKFFALIAERYKGWWW